MRHSWHLLSFEDPFWPSIYVMVTAHCLEGMYCQDANVSRALSPRADLHALLHDGLASKSRGRPGAEPQLPRGLQKHPFHQGAHSGVQAGAVHLRRVSAGGPESRPSRGESWAQLKHGLIVSCAQNFTIVSSDRRFVLHQLRRRSVLVDHVQIALEGRLLTKIVRPWIACCSDQTYGGRSLAAPKDWLWVICA